MMSLEDLKEWLELRDQPDYNGMYHDDIIDTEFNSNKDTGTKYSYANAFKDKNGDILEEPSEESMNDEIYGSYKYILEAGYNPKEIEGGSIDEHLKYHQSIINLYKKNTGKDPKYVAEIGFNAGVSASFYLSKGYDVTSFDLGFHSYCFYAKLWIDKKYPNKHTLINGSSFRSIPTYWGFSDRKFDIIFIDGDHTFFGAYWDIINCKNISHPDTLVILDNVVPHRGVGEGVYRAMLRALDDRYISYIGNKEIYQYGEEYHDGSALIKYNFDDDNYTTNEVDFKDIEKKVLSYAISNLLKNISMSKEEFREIYKIYLKYEDEISDYVKEKLEKKNNRFKFNKNNIDEPPNVKSNIKSSSKSSIKSRSAASKGGKYNNRW